MYDKRPFRLMGSSSLYEATIENDSAQQKIVPKVFDRINEMRYAWYQDDSYAKRANRETTRLLKTGETTHDCTCITLSRPRLVFYIYYANTLSMHFCIYNYTCQRSSILFYRYYLNIFSDII